MAIYFLQEGEGGAIKIGFTGGDPWSRMASLQTGNSKKLAMLAVAPGGQQEERALHQRFADLRLEGEWFAPDARLLGFIEGLAWLNPQRASTGDVDAFSPHGLNHDQARFILGLVDVHITMRLAEHALANADPPFESRAIDPMVSAECALRNSLVALHHTDDPFEHGRGAYSANAVEQKLNELNAAIEYERQEDARAAAVGAALCSRSTGTPKEGT